MTLFNVAILALAIPTGEPQYEITVTVDFDPPALIVEGRLENIDTQADPAAVHLTGLAQNVQWSDRNGNPLTAQSTPSDYDLLWTFNKPQETLVFSYELRQIDAPQLRTLPHLAFAGHGGETWYPQIDWGRLDRGRITFDLPVNTQLFTSGRRESSECRAQRIRESYLMRTPGKFAFAASPRFRRTRGAGCHVLSQTITNPGMLQEICNDSTGELERIFGGFPFSKPITIVEIEFGGPVTGTSEYGALFVSPSKVSDQTSARTHLAHEIGHQWWGLAVRAQPGEPGATLLTEGLAELGALSIATNGIVHSRVSAYRHYLDRLAKHFPEIEPDIQREVPQGQKQIVRNHRLATTKGALAYLDILRFFGEPAFRAALERFLARHRGGQVSYAQFKKHLVTELGEAAGAILNGWLDSKGPPRVRVTIEKERECHIVIRRGDDRKFPIQIDLHSRAGEWSSKSVVLEAGPVSVKCPQDFHPSDLLIFPPLSGIH